MVRLTEMTSLCAAAWLLCLVFMTSSLTRTEAYRRLQKRGIAQGDYMVSHWGAWGPWSACTRTCGGGVTQQKRPCLRRRMGSMVLTGANQCVGLYIQYKLCNTKPCPEGSTDFRTEQCEKYNHERFMGKRYRWETFIKASSPCELNCRAGGNRFYAKLADKVVDGTPCGIQSDKEICVDGMCKTVGCDGVLGSGQEVDKCGVCGGSNTECQIFSGTIDQDLMKIGYHTVVTIPAGAMYVNITEMSRSRNYLGLQITGGAAIFNGNWRIDYPGNYSAAGTNVMYSRSARSQSSTGEQILIMGPTATSLDVMMIYQQRNPGIYYEYVMRSPKREKEDRPLSSNDQEEPSQTHNSQPTRPTARPTTRPPPTTERRTTTPAPTTPTTRPSTTRPSTTARTTTTPPPPPPPSSTSPPVQEDKDKDDMAISSGVMKGTGMGDKKDTPKGYAGIMHTTTSGDPSQQHSTHGSDSDPADVSNQRPGGINPGTYVHVVGAVDISRGGDQQIESTNVQTADNRPHPFFGYFPNLQNSDAIAPVPDNSGPAVQSSLNLPSGANRSVLVDTGIQTRPNSRNDGMPTARTPTARPSTEPPRQTGIRGSQSSRPNNQNSGLPTSNQRGNNDGDLSDSRIGNPSITPTRPQHSSSTSSRGTNPSDLRPDNVPGVGNSQTPISRNPIGSSSSGPYQNQGGTGENRDIPSRGTNPNDRGADNVQGVNNPGMPINRRPFTPSSETYPNQRGTGIVSGENRGIPSRGTYPNGPRVDNVPEVNNPGTPVNRRPTGSSSSTGTYPNDPRADTVPRVNRPTNPVNVPGQNNPQTPVNRNPFDSSASTTNQNQGGASLLPGVNNDPVNRYRPTGIQPGQDRPTTQSQNQGGASLLPGVNSDSVNRYRPTGVQVGQDRPTNQPQNQGYPSIVPGVNSDPLNRQRPTIGQIGQDRTRPQNQGGSSFVPGLNNNPLNGPTGGQLGPDTSQPQTGFGGSEPTGEIIYNPNYRPPSNQPLPGQEGQAFPSSGQSLPSNGHEGVPQGYNPLPDASLGRPPVGQGLPWPGQGQGLAPQPRPSNGERNPFSPNLDVHSGGPIQTASNRPQTSGNIGVSSPGPGFPVRPPGPVQGQGNPGPFLEQENPETNYSPFRGGVPRPIVPVPGTAIEVGASQSEDYSSSAPEVGQGNQATLPRNYEDPNAPADATSLHIWMETGLTECSVPCAGGIQETVVQCVRENSFYITEDSMCDAAYRPIIRRKTCNTEPCPPVWNVSDWSSCSRTCGAGRQMRMVTCEQKVTQSVILPIPVDQCLGLPKPPDTQTCNRLTPCTSWRTGNWGECSAECGEGEQRREVACLDEARNVVAESECSHMVIPSESQSCSAGRCQSSWFSNTWSTQCSVECGSGTVSRRVICSTESTVAGSLPEDQCTGLEKPSSIQTCSEGNCGPRWFTSEWSRCSAECGAGTQSRSVICVSSDPSPRVLPTYQCPVPRPAITQACEGTACSRPSWFTSQWSECSASCGGGERTRHAKCLDGRMQPSTDCESQTRPGVMEACNIQRCKPVGPTVDPLCVDRFSYCDKILQARLCGYSYYRQRCCYSCYDE